MRYAERSIFKLFPWWFWAIVGCFVAGWIALAFLFGQAIKVEVDSNGGLKAVIERVWNGDPKSP